MALLVTVLLTWSLSTSAAEPSVTPYFTTDELPDLTVCLPPLRIRQGSILRMT